MLDLDNSILYMVGGKTHLERLLKTAGFEINEIITKKDSKENFDGVPVLYARYEHKNGDVSLQFNYATQEPLLRANIKSKDGSELLSFRDVVEEVPHGNDAKFSFNATMLLNHYGKVPLLSSRFESDKAREVGMRKNSRPLLEAIIMQEIPAILKPKGIYPTLVNFP